MSIEKNEVWDVLVKSLKETLTPQEQHLIDCWLEENDLNRKSFQSFVDLRFLVVPNESDKYKEQIFAEIIYRISKKQKATRKLWILSSVAAAFLLLLTTAIVFFQFGERETNTQLVEIITPKGIKSRVTLSDGSIIALNSSSRVTYPNRFYGKNREITFEGEGFFTIAKDNTRPFIVKTSTIKIQVTGTRFNLKTYDNENFVETTLEEGSVNISELGHKNRYFKLHPGKQAIFDKCNHAFNVIDFDPEKSSSWQSDKYYFMSKSFEDIAHVLERRFDVTIDIQSEKLKNEIFSGDFVRGENLEQILTIIKKSTKMDYTINGQFITIKE